MDINNLIFIYNSLIITKFIHFIDISKKYQLDKISELIVSFLW